MRLLFNIIIIALIALLAYMLYNSINVPIKFQAEKQKREAKVIAQLEDIRDAQEIFRKITGKFAGDFDTLAHVLRNDSIPTINLEEDPEFPGDPDKFIKTTTYSAAIDSIRSLGISLDSLGYIPYASAKFDIEADTLRYQSTLVNVVQVGTKYKNFMGDFADPKFAKYDQSYNPEKLIKFGDLTKPNISGSWDR